MHSADQAAGITTELSTMTSVISVIDPTDLIDGAS